MLGRRQCRATESGALWKVENSKVAAAQELNKRELSLAGRRDSLHGQSGISENPFFTRVGLMGM